jgi:hypothetical protein
MEIENFFNLLVKKATKTANEISTRKITSSSELLTTTVSAVAKKITSSVRESSVYVSTHVYSETTSRSYLIAFCTFGGIVIAFCFISVVFLIIRYKRGTFLVFLCVFIINSFYFCSYSKPTTLGITSTTTTTTTTCFSTATQSLSSKTYQN